MSNVLVNENYLSAIADSIRSKNGTTNTYKPSEMAGAIDSISTGSSELVSKDVDFIDYDGTLLYSYTLAEIQAMTELPPLPTQEGLICQEWNWSLEDIKAFGRRLIVGATYITEDESTCIHIDLTDDKLLEMRLTFSQTINNGVEVDWGDGSPIMTYDHTSRKEVRHQYNTIGKYVISLKPIGDCILQFSGDYYYYNIIGSIHTKPAKYYYSACITEVNFGRNVLESGMYVFYYCNNLKYVTFPKGLITMSKHSFNFCYDLKAIIIPNSVTTISESAFEFAYNTEIISIPNSITTIGKYGISNTGVREIIIPDSVTSLNTVALGSNADLLKVVIGSGITELPQSTFSSCYNLQEVIIPEHMIAINKSCFYDCKDLKEFIIPEGVITIEDTVFSGCRKLKKLIIPDTVTKIGTNQVCYGLYSLKEIKLPSNMTTMGNQFLSGAYCLTELDIPANVTTIGDNAMSYCYSLTELKIPSGVTNIGSRAFYGCNSMSKFDFSECLQVPTLVDTNAFLDNKDGRIFIVPDALYDEWIAATNWSNYADYIVKVSEVVS